MIFKKILLLFLFYAAICFCQNNSEIGIVTGEKTTYIPVYKRQGMVYIPVKLFADVLGIKYTVLTENNKIKFHFPRYNLILTSQNPYLVSESEDKLQEIVQLPTSTYLLNNNIYVPLTYSLKILEKALGTFIYYKPPDRLIIKEFNYKDVTELKNKKSDKIFSISGLTIDQKANGTLIRVNTERKIPSYTSSFKDGILCITLKNSSADVNKLNNSGDKGVVKEIKAKNINNNVEIQIAVTQDYTAS